MAAKSEAKKKQEDVESVASTNGETESESKSTCSASINTQTADTASPETETPCNGMYPQYQDLVGNTPLLDLSHMVKNSHGVEVRLFAKAEFMNPGFSIKDRIVLNIMNSAEACGALKPGGTVVAASSGNTGAATAMFCAMRGYGCVITTGSKCSVEKQSAIKAYGALLLVSPPGSKEGSPMHYMEVAKLLAEQHEGWFDINQYDNLQNPDAHRMTLGPEIYSQTNGKVTHFVAAGSTGGTISGTGQYLKAQNENIKIILGDPAGSIFAGFFKTGCIGESKPFLVEGVGKGCIPGAMDFSVIDSTVEVTDQQAFDMCHHLARAEGLCVGGSGGLNITAALNIADNLTSAGVIVTVLPDLGVKYLSKIYNNEWMIANGIVPLPEETTLPRATRRGVPDTDAPEAETPNVVEFPTIGESCYYSSLVGNTPLVDVSHLMKNPACSDTKVLAKCEFFNPGFSIKDRIILNIFDKAERDGLLGPGSTVVAASSGNTGAATAMMCAMRGYKCVIITSPKCSKEKMDAIKAYGACLMVSVAGAKEGTPGHYMEMAKSLKAKEPSWFDVDQYDNKSNPEGHYLTLGPEVVNQTHGTVTHFVAAGSTGGTISGVGKYLKESNPDVEVILADPVGSIFTNYFRTGEIGNAEKFLVEGVGKASIPGAMDLKVVNNVFPVTDQQAFDMCAILSRTIGLCAGGSGGLNVHAALRIGEKITTPGSVVVTVLPDLGVKYLSKVYNEDWLVANGLCCPDKPCVEGQLLGLER